MVHAYLRQLNIVRNFYVNYYLLFFYEYFIIPIYMDFFHSNSNKSLFFIELWELKKAYLTNLTIKYVFMEIDLSQ